MSTTSKKPMSTISCPKCSQTLPAWAQRCQFCGAEMHPGFVRPVDAYKYKVDNRMTWKEAAYVVVSVLVVLQGVFGLLLAFNVIPNDIYKAGGGTFIGVFAAVRTGLGLGMLFHQLWAQFIMKWVCILSILFEGSRLLIGLMFATSTKFGDWGAVAMSAVTFILVSFTLYLLYSEADV